MQGQRVPQWHLHTRCHNLLVEVTPAETPGAFVWSVRQASNYMGVGWGREYDSKIALDCALTQAWRVNDAATNLQRCIDNDAAARRLSSPLTMEALAVYNEVTSNG